MTTWTWLPLKRIFLLIRSHFWGIWIGRWPNSTLNRALSLCTYHKILTGHSSSTPLTEGRDSAWFSPPFPVPILGQFGFMTSHASLLLLFFLSSFRLLLPMQALVATGIPELARAGVGWRGAPSPPAGGGTALMTQTHPPHPLHPPGSCHHWECTSLLGRAHIKLILRLHFCI